MMSIIFSLLIVLYMVYRFFKKRRGSKDNKIEVLTFEEAFKETYGTTWDAWITVKRDILHDGDAFVSSITTVFNDMYCTVQEINGGVKK